MDGNISDIARLKKDLTNEERLQFDSQYSNFQKNPTTALVLSILLGAFGIDRFYVGDTGLGIAKLLVIGGSLLWGWVLLYIPTMLLGIWVIVDWFMIQKAAARKNAQVAQDVRESVLSMRDDPHAAATAAPAEEVVEDEEKTEE